MRDFEFVWMTVGSAVYHRDGQAIDVPVGGVVLCQPGATDAFDWDRRVRSQHLFVHFDVEAVPSHWPVREAWPTVRVIDGEDVFRPMFRHLLTWKGRGDPGLLRSMLAQLLAVFVLDQAAITRAASEPMPDPVRLAIEAIHHHVAHHPGKAMTLDDLATIACVTPAYLCRLFKQTVGESPLACLRLARLDLALTRLTRSNEAVKRIAHECGFASPFHFSRRFKEAFGASPVDVRAMAQQGRVPPMPRLHRIQRF